MKDETKSNTLQRLARIEGQVRGVARMIDEDRYCVDVVRQVQAIKAALASLEQVVLDDHLATCVDQALTSNDIENRREKVAELVSIFGGRQK